MGRLPHFLAAALIVATSAAPAFGQSATMRAEFAAAFERDTEVIVDGKLWQCRGNACTTRGDDPRPTVACRRLSRKVGPVARFTTPRAELDANDLATCNKDHG